MGDDGCVFSPTRGGACEFEDGAEDGASAFPFPTGSRMSSMVVSSNGVWVAGLLNSLKWEEFLVIELAQGCLADIIDPERAVTVRGWGRYGVDNLLVLGCFTSTESPTRIGDGEAL